jgi:hypothetical protein
VIGEHDIEIGPDRGERRGLTVHTDWRAQGQGKRAAYDLRSYAGPAGNHCGTGTFSVRPSAVSAPCQRIALREVVMKTDELVTELGAMFPQAFNEASLESWFPIYSAALERYEGAALRAAFDEILSDWKYPSAPKPADFAAAAGYGGQ